jgi:hypothetical protein
MQYTQLSQPVKRISPAFLVSVQQQTFLFPHQKGVYYHRFNNPLCIQYTLHCSFLTTW